MCHAVQTIQIERSRLRFRRRFVDPKHLRDVYSHLSRRKGVLQPSQDLSLSNAATTSSRTTSGTALSEFLQVSEGTEQEQEQEQEQEEGEGSGPCKDDADPNCHYFYKTWTGKVTDVPHALTHTKEFIADFSGKTLPEQRASKNFVNGGPYGSVGTSWVKPCSNFPYCTETPPPPPLVPVSVCVCIYYI